MVVPVKCNKGLAGLRMFFRGPTLTPKSVTVLPGALWLHGGLLRKTYFDVRSFVINIWRMYFCGLFMSIVITLLDLGLCNYNASQKINVGP